MIAMGRSLRATIVPQCGIILHPNSGTLPDGFSHETTLFNKFAKQVPNSCTNPGSSVGADCHTETSAGAAHTHTSASVSHTHTLVTTTDTPGGGGSPKPGAILHSHSVPSDSIAGTVSICSVSGAHIHPSISLLPPFISSRYIKKTTSLGLRTKQIPKCSIILWPNTIATIPKEYAIQSCYNTKFIRGVLNACIAPGTTGGTCTHQHLNTVCTHTHGQQITCHGHAWPASYNHVGIATSATDSAGGNNVLAPHNHLRNTMAVTNLSGSAGSTVIQDSHQHTSQNHIPQHHEIAFIKRTGFNLRNPGVPEDAMVMWLGTLASIPTNFALANGVSCTPNLLNRYPQGVPTSCTDPGSQAGNATHQSNTLTHTHNASSLDHMHAVTGQDATCQDGQANGSPGGGGGRSFFNHDHCASSSQNPTETWCPAAADSHQHAATSNNPATIEVAYIQKV